MKFTKEAMETININYQDNIYSKPVKKELDLKLDDCLNGSTILKNNWAICTVDEISDMINQLTVMKEQIERTTGVIL